MSVIISPKTGKLIKTDSTAYQELINDPEYKVFFFDNSEQATATLQPSGSPVNSFEETSFEETSFEESSPVYFQKASPVFSPSSPDNSLVDIPMPIPLLIPVSEVSHLPTFIRSDNLKIPLKPSRNKQ